MANRLKMALVQSILTLHARDWSARRIARELQVNRETVSRHVRLAGPSSDGVPAGCSGEPNPANAPILGPGSAALPDPATAPFGATPGRLSDCQPWREIIQAKQAQPKGGLAPCASSRTASAGIAGYRPIRPDSQPVRKIFSFSRQNPGHRRRIPL